MPEPIVTLNEESPRAGPRVLVRKTVEEMPSGPLEEAGDLVGAGRHGRTAGREACRAGRCERKLATTSGEATIRMPKLKGMRFTTAVIERRRRRETSAGEAMAEMHLAGVPAGRIEDASEMLRGSSVSAAAVPNLSGKASEAVEGRGSGPLGRACPYACVDGIYLKRSRGGSCENVAATVAIGVNDDGYREVTGAAEGFTESAGRWRELLSRLKPGGPRGVGMFAGDKAAGMVGPAAEVFPEAACQRRAARFYRNVLAKAPRTGRAKVAATLKAIHAMETREASGRKAAEVADEPGSMRLEEAAKTVRGGCAETLTYTRLPAAHWRRIGTNGAIERLNREIRGRARVAGAFPDGRGALMLVTARLKYVAGSERGSRRHLDVTLLDE